jgi:hypothetical protein
MSNGTFDFNEFLKESKDVLVKPDYFSTMKISGGLTEPLIKAVIYGAVAGVFSFLWSLLNLGSTALGVFGGGAVGIMLFVWAIIGAVIGLFIGGVIVLVLSSICKGNTDFEANVRVTAALMVVMPISAFLGFASGLNLYFGIVVGLAVNIFMLWLLYKGLVQALKAKAETARIVMFVLIGIFVLFMLIGLGTKRKMQELKNTFENIELPQN